MAATTGRRGVAAAVGAVAAGAGECATVASSAADIRWGLGGAEVWWALAGLDSALCVDSASATRAL